MHPAAIKLLLSLYNAFTWRSDQRAFPWRYNLLKLSGISIDRKASLGGGLYFLNGHNITLEKGVSIGYGAHLYDWAPVLIGENTAISNHFRVVSATHSKIDYSSILGPVTIGRNCWFGINVTIVGPCTIGDNVIVGAGSTVLGSLPADTVCAGTPAKPIRHR